MLGIVKFFDPNKGFGFITADDDHKDYFVHQTEIKMEGFRTLFEEQRVEFESGKDDQGRDMAKNVKKINE